jgi:hypothetical protein
MVSFLTGSLSFEYPWSRVRVPDPYYEFFLWKRDRTTQNTGVNPAFAHLAILLLFFTSFIQWGAHAPHVISGSSNSWYGKIMEGCNMTILKFIKLCRLRFFTSHYNTIIQVQIGLRIDLITQSGRVDLFFWKKSLNLFLVSYCYLLFDILVLAILIFAIILLLVLLPSSFSWSSC